MTALRGHSLSRRASVSSEYETAADCGLHRAALTQRRLGTIDRPTGSHDHTQHSRCTLYTSRAKQLCLQQTRATVQHLCISPRHDNTVVAQWHTDARITTAMAAYVPGGADSDALQLEQHVS
jgi:hypothetical protein